MKVIALSFILNVITVILPCIKHLRHSKEKKLSVKINDTRQHPLRRNTKTNQVLSTPAYAFDLRTQAGWDYKGWGLSGIVSGGLECMERYAPISLRGKFTTLVGTKQ